MKKRFTLTTLFCSLFLAFNGTAQDQIPNSNFENWEDIVVEDTLDHWITTNAQLYPFDKNVTPIEDGVSGKGLLIETITIPGEEDYTTQGGIILASSLEEDEDAPIGYPYDDFVSGFNAHLRYDIEPMDTGFVLIFLQNDGVIFSFDAFPIYGSQETWELFSWDLSSPITTPDAVTIGIFSSGYNDTEPIEGSWVEVDSVFFDHLGDSVDPIPNHDFENWTEQTLEVAEEWSSLDEPLAALIGINNVTKSTDAIEGDYSLKIETFEFNVEEEVLPFVTNGYFDFLTEELSGGSDFTGEPILFKGQYKFSSEEEEDTSSVYLMFWNDEGDIAEYGDTLYPVEDWTEFSIDIDLDFTPDSVIAVLFGGSTAGSEIYYDDTRFVYDDVSVEENDPVSFTTFPNPTNSGFQLSLNDTVDIIITDLTGKTVFNSQQATGIIAIETTSWAEGMYLIQVHNGNKFKTERLVVQH